MAAKGVGLRLGIKNRRVSAGSSNVEAQRMLTWMVQVFIVETKISENFKTSYGILFENDTILKIST